MAAILLYLSVRRIHPQFPPLPLYYGLFLQNYLGQPGLSVTWSLCVGEQFYLRLPIVLFLAMQVGGRRCEADLQHDIKSSGVQHTRAE